MKIKISKNLYVNLNTLVKIEWRKYYPVLVVHERFEKILKWILRIIAICGIATSIFSIPVWYISLGLAIVVALIEQFFEKTVFEYTTMVIQPFPDFELDYSQWKTNGFLIPKEKDSKDLPHFGPAFMDEKYAKNFFRYLRTWIDNNSNDDKENNLVVSIIIEPNDKYTTYIYANLGRKRLNNMFKFMNNVSKLEKYGKRQQQFITQMFYWNTLDFKDGYYIKQFLDFQNENDPYYFTPSVIQPFKLPPKFLFDYSIKKYHLKVKKRIELLKNEPEYHINPAKLKKNKKKKHLINNQTSENDIIDDIQKALNNPVDIGFMPNQGNSVGVINLCYEGNCILEFEAYRQLIKVVGENEVILEITDFDDYINIVLSIPSKEKMLHLNNLQYDKNDLEKFLHVKGGGNKVALLIGYPPANERRVILEKNMSPIVVTWKYVRKDASR